MTPRFDIARETIFLGLVGSHAYGTAHEGSDIDIHGVCIAPLSVRLSLFDRFEQAPVLLHEMGEVGACALASLGELPKRCSGKIETTISEVAKFLGLCANANPHALELLCLEPSEWLYVTDAWKTLHEARRHFLTRKLYETYVGYGRDQLQKIRTHRGWLLNPPAAAPRREDFGLPDVGTLNADDRNRIERSIADKLRTYNFGTIEMSKLARIQLTEAMKAFWADAAAGASLRDVATTALQLPSGVVQTLDAERRYRAASKHWQSYVHWQETRNPGRAELERQYGFDTKHGAHLLRLLKTGLELLRFGELRVRRSDAAELVSVLRGELTYDELVARSDAIQAEMKTALEASPLPADIDPAFVDALFLSLVEPHK